MKRSRRIFTTLGLALALGATVPACVVSGSGRLRTRGTVVVDAPPPPREERIETRSGYVFVRGHWEWNGNQYDWRAGHWERQKAGHRWDDGRWEQRNNGWVWVDGGWRTDGAHGTVVVNDGTGGGSDRPRERDHRGGGDTVVVVSGGPTQAPPSPRAENQGSRSGYIWVTGRWDWKGGQWDWVPGHWERVKANHSWRDGRWELQGNVYIWVDGGWEKGEGRPKVRDHRD